MSPRTEVKKAPRIDTSDDACEVNVVDARKVKNVQRKMHSADAVRLLAETFRVLGDPTRVKIVFALATEELCVCDLATIVGASQSAGTAGGVFTVDAVKNLPNQSHVLELEGDL